MSALQSEADIGTVLPSGQLCANTGSRPYSITSSALASSVSDTVRPRALAHLRLIAIQNLVGNLKRQIGGVGAFEVPGSSRD
jgi:hypothetical protein